MPRQKNAPLTLDMAQSMALQALEFILGEEALITRFMALSGLSEADLKENIESLEFQAQFLEFLIMHEPDLIDFAGHVDQKPETIVQAWQKLGGGVGHM